MLKYAAPVVTGACLVTVMSCTNAPTGPLSTSGLASGSISVASGSAATIASGSGSTLITVNSSVSLTPGGTLSLTPGTTVGLSPGTSVGLNPGTSIGLNPGTAVGLNPGTTVGLNPGTSIGITPGSTVSVGGGTIGLNPGTTVGLAPGTVVTVGGGTVSLAPGQTVTVGGTVVTSPGAYAVSSVSVVPTAATLSVPPQNPGLGSAGYVTSLQLDARSLLPTGAILDGDLVWTSSAPELVRVSSVGNQTTVQTTGGALWGLQALPAQVTLVARSRLVPSLTATVSIVVTDDAAAIIQLQ
jgi:hypothetical protein